MDGWMMDGWMDDGWMDGWMDDGWMMDGWLNFSDNSLKFTCFHIKSVFFEDVLPPEGTWTANTRLLCIKKCIC